MRLLAKAGHSQCVIDEIIASRKIKCHAGGQFRGSPIKVFLHSNDKPLTGICSHLSRVYDLLQCSICGILLIKRPRQSSRPPIFGNPPCKIPSQNAWRWRALAGARLIPELHRSIPPQHERGTRHNKQVLLAKTVLGCPALVLIENLFLCVFTGGARFLPSDGS